MAKPLERTPVDIISEVLQTSQPRVGETFYTLNVNYVSGSDPIAGLFLPVSEWYKEKTPEFLKQREARRGPLFDDFIKRRNKAIEEDLKRRRALRPERVEI